MNYRQESVFIFNAPINSLLDRLVQSRRLKFLTRDWLYRMHGIITLNTVNITVDRRVLVLLWSTVIFTADYRAQTYRLPTVKLYGWQMLKNGFFLKKNSVHVSDPTISLVEIWIMPTRMFIILFIFVCDMSNIVQTLFWLHAKIWSAGIHCFLLKVIVIVLMHREQYAAWLVVLYSLFGSALVASYIQLRRKHFPLAYALETWVSVFR